MDKKTSIRTAALLIAVYFAVILSTIYGCPFEAFPLPDTQTATHRKWEKQVEAFLSENIGFHDTLFRIRSSTDLLLGEKMIQDVYVTDEMLLKKTELSKADEKTAGMLGDFYEEYHLPVCLILVPSAIEIYSDRLPNNPIRTEQETAIRAVYAATGTEIRCIDACNALSAASDAYIFYRTDSRWTSYGAYCVYKSAIRKLGFTAVPYNRYVISHLSTDFRGDLYSRTLCRSVKADVLDMYHVEGGAEVTEVIAYDADGTAQSRGSELYDKDALETEDMYRFYLGEPVPKLVIRTSLENGRKLLLYKDDLGDSFVPFLLQHYSEICVVDLEKTGTELAKYVDPSEYTQVLFLSDMENWCRLYGAA